VTLPSDPQERKDTPIYSGVLLYFPDALAEVARVSKVGNDQHNPGQPLHWDKSKSQDEGDALIRHQLEAGTFDTDGTRHSAKVAWRALAQLQRELEQPAVSYWAVRERVERDMESVLSLTPSEHEAVFAERGPHAPTREELAELFGDEEPRA